MKKSLVLLTAIMFTATSAFAAGTLGKWAEQTSNKINAKEAAVTKKVTDHQNAYKKQQAEAQAKRDAQKAEQQAKQDAAKKRIETKKQQWNQLINN